MSVAAKRGRPPKPEGARENRIAVRVSDDELGILQRAADAAGISISEYIRTTSLRSTKKKP